MNFVAAAGGLKKARGSLKGTRTFAADRQKWEIGSAGYACSCLRTFLSFLAKWLLLFLDTLSSFIIIHMLLWLAP